MKARMRRSLSRSSASTLCRSAISEISSSRLRISRRRAWARPSDRMLTTVMFIMNRSSPTVLLGVPIENRKRGSRKKNEAESAARAVASSPGPSPPNSAVIITAG